MSSIMSNSCPMPNVDFDIITLGHGSGGVLTHKLLHAGVFDLFQNEYLDEKHDGAIFEIEGKIAFSTDSFVIHPIFFPGGNIGDLSINGTVNDLAMCGAKPKYLSLSFIIEEGLAFQEFWDILVNIKMAADKANVLIVTGDTKVVEKGKGDKIFVNVSGVGELHPQANISEKRIKIGDKIICSGAIATHGVAIMSVREGLEFETTIQSDSCNLNHSVWELIQMFGDKIHLLRDPTRGGIATVLNEIAIGIKKGIEINQDDLFIKDEVFGACELLGLDPLYVANEGIFLSIVTAEIADEYLAKLKTLEFGENASIIGEVVNEHPKQVILNSSIGGKRVVNMLIGDQLPRIC